MPCSLPRWTGQVLVGFFPAARPSPNNGRVGIHNFTFEACSSFTRVTACKVAARPKADPCPEASIRPVTQPNRSVASMSYRQLHRWNLPPLMTCALGAHRYPSVISYYSGVFSGANSAGGARESLPIRWRRKDDRFSLFCSALTI
jgi:hypothetical protein